MRIKWKVFAPQLLVGRPHGITRHVKRCDSFSQRFECLMIWHFISFNSYKNSNHYTPWATQSVGLQIHLHTYIECWITDNSVWFQRICECAFRGHMQQSIYIPTHKWGTHKDFQKTPHFPFFPHLMYFLSPLSISPCYLSTFLALFYPSHLPAQLSLFCPSPIFRFSSICLQ